MLKKTLTVSNDRHLQETETYFQTLLWGEAQWAMNPKTNKIKAIQKKVLKIGAIFYFFLNKIEQKSAQSG